MIYHIQIKPPRTSTNQWLWRCSIKIAQQLIKHVWLLWVLEANTKKWNSSCCRQATKKLQQPQQNCYGWRTTFRQEHDRTKASQELPIKLPLVGQTDKEFLWQQQVQLQITPYRIHHTSAPAVGCTNPLLEPQWHEGRGPRLACIGRWLPVSWLCGLTLPKPRFVFTYQEVWTTCIKNSVLLDSCSLITSHKIWASSSHTTCLNKQRDIISFACFLASPHYCDKQPTTGKVQKTTTCNHGLLGHHHPWHEQVDPLPGQPDHESPTKKCNERKQKYSRQALEKTHTHLGQRFFSAAEELNCFPPAATSFWTWKILIQKPHEYRDWMVFQVKQDLCMQKRKLQ